MVPRGRLTPEVGALLLRALDAARETLYQKRRANEVVPPASDPAAEAPTRAQQQADALALPRVSGVKWWSMWTPRSWRIRSNSANPCWKRGATFPRERRGGWRATRAEW